MLGGLALALARLIAAARLACIASIDVDCISPVPCRG